ncbi:MAG: hypothetical protein N2560_07450 [Ignavibacteria bacterium]|nr:hypothetical protein [Ignavibacteria bacterium]
MIPFIVITIFLANLNCFAIDNNQQRDKVIHREQISIFAELAGQGLLLSLNADYLFHPNFSVRGGFSFLLLGFGIPLSIYYLTDAGTSHHFEFGAGLTYVNVATISILGGGSSSKGIPLFNGSFGYRYQPRKGGFFFRVAFTPFIRFETNEYFDYERRETRTSTSVKFHPFAGISLGFSLPAK